MYLALATMMSLLALSFAAIAAPARTSNRGVTPAKRTTRFIPLPGALASANNTCLTAITVPSTGPFPWTDTQDTTGNGVEVLPSCSSDGGANEWYSFTPDTSGSYSFSTCASAVDTVMALYTGACGSLVEVDCVDDSCGLQSFMMSSLTAGTTYTIQILGYSGEAGSIPFTVDRSPDPPTVVTSFPANPSGYMAWGCGYTDFQVVPNRAPGPGSVWTGDYDTLEIRQFTTAGFDYGPFYYGYWADMDFDDVRGMMYQMDIPGGGETPPRQDNCVHTWNPMTGAAGPTICDPANVWSAIEHQAVAHDPDTDTLYVGGWNDGMVYRVAGLNSTTPLPGTVLDSWTVGPVSGLAWLCDGTLAAALNEPQSRILILDPASAMAVLRSYTIPNSSEYCSAGMDAQPDGQVWLINQEDQVAYLVDLGAVCGAPCTLTCTASASPTSGTVPLAVTFSATATPTECTSAPVFAWTFGDGASSTDQNPSHTYVAPGSFTWTLTVTVDQSAICTQTGTVTVTPPPAYDVYIYDDYGRASLCFNSGTGEFQYTVLRGVGAVSTFTGMAETNLLNNVLTFRTPAGLPYSLQGSYLMLYHKGRAAFTQRPLRINSTAYDSNTLNNPPGCAMLPPGR
jgi:hypothetical protein